ncbi:hypothetical protein WUE2121_2165 [Neisseria meningitidis]|nr:hypothetical protein WUE2121_2165 [Neisseria meningitidis]
MFFLCFVHKVAHIRFISFFRRHGTENIQLGTVCGGLVFQSVQMLLGGFQCAYRQAGEFGNGDAVAFAGGTRLDLVQENDVLSLFERGKVHIDGGGVGFGQVGQLEIVGSKQAEGFVFLQQVFGNGVREGEAVESGSTTSDFVH